MRRVSALAVFIVVVFLIPVSSNAFHVSIGIDDSLAGLVTGFEFHVSGDINTNGALGGAIPDGWFAGAVTTAATGISFSMPSTTLLPLPEIIVSWEVNSGDFNLDSEMLADDSSHEIPTSVSVTNNGGDLLYTLSAASGISRTGFWVVPGEAVGRAIVIEIQDGILAFGWGAYDAETGKSAWLFSTGPMSDADYYEGDLLEFADGSCFDCPYEQAKSQKIGTITIEFTSDTTAVLNAFGFSKTIQKSVF
jgi:hypothetical protein